MYTRQQLALRFGVSLSTIRRILDALDIHHTSEVSNMHHQNMYMYLDTVPFLILRYLLQATLKVKSETMCYICKKRYPISLMLGTRCYDCYIKRFTLPLVYGKEVWNKVVDAKLVLKSILKLKSFISTNKKTD